MSEQLNQLSENLAKLEMLPDFAKASYATQIQSRKVLSEYYLQQSPEFQAISDQAKNQVLRELIYKPPAGWESSPKASEFVNLAQQIKLNPSNRENPAVGVAIKLLNNEDFIGNSGLLTPIYHASQWFAEKLNLHSGIANNRLEIDSREYLRYTVQGVPDALANYQISTFFSKTAGVVSSLLVTKAAFSGTAGQAIAKSPIGEYVSKGLSASRELMVKNEFQRWMSRSVVPLALDSAKEGVLLSLGNVLEKNFNDEYLNQHPLRERLKTVVLSFGEEFLFDFMFTSVGSLAWNMGIKPLKQIFGSAKLRSSALNNVANDLITTEEAFENFNRYILQGENFPKEIFEQMSDQQQKEFLRLRRLTQYALDQNIVKNPSDNEFKELWLQTRGVKVEPSDNGLKLSYLFDNEPRSTTVKTYDQAFDWAFEQYKLQLAKTPSIDEAMLVAAGNQRLRFFEQVTGDLVTDSRPAQSLVDGIISRNGVVDTRKISYSVRDYLKQLNVSDEVVKKIKFEIDPDYFDRTLTKANTFSFPQTIATAEQTETFINRFMQQIRDIIPEEQAVNLVKEQSKLVDRLTKQLQKSFELPQANKDWLKYAQENYFPQNNFIQDSQGKWTVTNKQTNELVGVFENDQALTRYFARSQNFFTPEYTKSYFKLEYGLDLHYNPKSEGWYIRQGNRNLFSGQTGFKSINEIFDQYPQLTPKLPIDAMPDMMFLDNTLKKVEVRGRYVFGPADKLRDFANSFSDAKPRSKVKHVKTNLNRTLGLIPDSQLYVLEAPDLNLRKVFTSSDEAQKYLTSTFDNMTDLKDLALAKGVNLSFQNGSFVLQDFHTGELLKADNLTEAKNLLSLRASDPVFGKSLDESLDNLLAGLTTDSPELFAKQGTEILTEPQFDEYFKQFATSEKRYIRGVKYDSLRALLGSSESYFATVSRKTNNFDIYRIYQQVDKGRLTARGASNNFDLGINAIFKGNSHKHKIELARVFLNGRDSTTWEEAAKKLNLTLSDQDKALLSGARSLLGSGTVDNPGMSLLFGIDGYKLVDKYLPELRIAMLDKSFNTEALARNALTKFYGGSANVPKELKLFAENLRTQDLVKLLDELPLDELLKRYAHAGFKAKYLREPWEQATSWLMKNGKTLDDVTKNKFATYLTQTMGIVDDDLEFLYRQASDAFAKDFTDRLAKFGLKDADKLITRDIIGTFQSLTVAATMSFRPALAMRNMMQIWLTLAPLVGNESTFEALKHFNNHADEIISHLRSTGRITTIAPIMGMQSSTGSSKLMDVIQKANRIGMTPYKNSDEFTRGVVAGYVDLNFDRALKNQNNKITDLARFARDSGIDNLRLAEQHVILDNLVKGKVLVAKDLYGDILTSRTMFPYSPGSNPMLFKGLFGRVFGMYGHYPVYFMQNIIDGIASPERSVMKRIGFAVTLAMNSAALYGAARAIFGVDVKQFLFSNAMVFDGGPYYKLFNETLSTTSGAMTGSSRRITQMKSLTKSAADIMVPGYLNARYFNEALKLNEKGDYYGALMSMLSFKYVDELDPYREVFNDLQHQQARKFLHQERFAQTGLEQRRIGAVQLGPLSF